MPQEPTAAESSHELDLDRAAALPRLEPGAARALSLLYGRAGTSTLELRDTRFVLRWDAQRHAAQHERLYRFTLGSHVGCLGLDFFAESLLLVDERNVGLLPVDLRYLLLADALHPLVQRLEQALGLRFEWEPVDRHAQALGSADHERDALFRIEHASGIRAGLGFVRFETDAGFEALARALPTSTHVARAAYGWLRLPVSLVIGTTRLPLGSARHLESGDVVVIDTAHPTPRGLPLVARVDGADQLEIQALADASRITVSSWSPKTMSQTPDAASADQPDALQGPSSTGDTWDDLQVPLRFEIPGLSIALAELQALKPGHVFELKQPLHRGEVQVLAHGRQIATGYLVAVGDRLAVRIAQIAAGPDE